MNLGECEAVDFSLWKVGETDGYSFKLATAFSLLLSEFRATSFSSLKDKIKASKVKRIYVSSDGSFAAAVIALSIALELECYVYLAQDEDNIRFNKLTVLGASKVYKEKYLQDAVSEAKAASNNEESIFLHPYEERACAYASYGMTKLLLERGLFNDCSAVCFAAGGLGLASGAALALNFLSEEIVGERIKCFVSEEAGVGKVLNLALTGKFKEIAPEQSLVPSCNTGTVAKYSIPILFYFIDGVVSVSKADIVKTYQEFKNQLGNSETSPVLTIAAAKKIKEELKLDVRATVCGRLEQCEVR